MGLAFPETTIVLELPELLDPDNRHARVNRIHDRAVKEAGRKTLVQHQVQRLPGHFAVEARGKYRHHARSPEVATRKRVRGQADLVRTGSTQTLMTRRAPHALRAGGNAGAGTVRFTMVLRFPEYFRQRATVKRGVTREKMADEIARWTGDEEATAARQFRDNYLDLMRARLSSRVRKRISARLAQLGI